MSYTRRLCNMIANHSCQIRSHAIGCWPVRCSVAIEICNLESPHVCFVFPGENLGRYYILWYNVGVTQIIYVLAWLNLEKFLYAFFYVIYLFFLLWVQLQWLPSTLLTMRRVCKCVRILATFRRHKDCWAINYVSKANGSRNVSAKKFS